MTPCMYDIQSHNKVVLVVLPEEPAQQHCGSQNINGSLIDSIIGASSIFESLIHCQQLLPDIRLQNVTVGP